MKNAGISRLLFGFAAAIFMLGAAAHAKAFFGSASRIIDGSAARVFFAGELKVLWLADSATLMGLAVVFGLMAAKPRWAASPLICVSWIPAATTVLLYYFLGPFYAAHMLLVATLMIIVAALLLPSNRTSIRDVAAVRAGQPAL